MSVDIIRNLSGFILFGGVLLAILLMVQQLSDNTRSKYALTSIALLIIGMAFALMASMFIFSIDIDFLYWLIFVSATFLGAAFCVSILGHARMIEESGGEVYTQDLFLKFYSLVIIIASISFMAAVILNGHTLLAIATLSGMVSGIFGFIKIPWPGQNKKEDNIK